MVVAAATAATDSGCSRSAPGALRVQQSERSEHQSRSSVPRFPSESRPDQRLDRRRQQRSRCPAATHTSSVQSSWRTSPCCPANTIRGSIERNSRILAGSQAAANLKPISSPHVGSISHGSDVVPGGMAAVIGSPSLASVTYGATGKAGGAQWQVTSAARRRLVDGSSASIRGRRGGARRGGRKASAPSCGFRAR